MASSGGKAGFQDKNGAGDIATAVDREVVGEGSWRCANRYCTPGTRMWQELYWTVEYEFILTDIFEYCHGVH